MQQQFFHSFYTNLLTQQLQQHQHTNPIFDYIDILLSICKKSSTLFNNSRPSLQSLTSYIANNLLFYTLEQIPSSSNKLLQNLSIEQNYVIYFTQICYRFVLLGYLCKLGEEDKKKEWKFGIQEFIRQAKIEFMFNYGESLATVMVVFVDKIVEVCSQVGFLDILCRIFLKFELDYVEAHVRKLMANAKQNWMANHNKIKTQFSCKRTESSQNKASQISKSRSKPRKTIKIMDISPKQTPDQGLKRRISQFRQYQKKRLSQNIQSSKKRTIFQSRKHTIRMSNCETETYQQQQSFYTQKHEDETHIQPNTDSKIVQIKQQSIQIVSVTQTKQSKPIKKQYFRQMQQTVTILKQSDIPEDSIMIPGTPPKLKCKQISMKM